ncbi:hypothetical protein BN4901_1330 [Citrobacter europaeus]|uniref:Uncharacterized protein n=1 Tax=Citrobacter europaeus TaxID=1914243 RepID=A0ABY0JLA9_9ENTR|nr:hypothetical protein BN4901_1330 [Citrobacter europaeus]
MLPTGKNLSSVLARKKGEMRGATQSGILRSDMASGLP